MKTDHIKAVVIGGSAGSLEVLLTLFDCLPEKFRLSIIIISHLHPLDDGGLVDFFSLQTTHTVKEADDKERVRQGILYCPPANYHLLVERDKTFALSVDPKVNYARPSIDVLFQSAAVTWADRLMGIILTGANSDGAEGISTIKHHGGFTVAQDPAEATYPVMPQAAVNTGNIDEILSINKICAVLQQMGSVP